MVYNGVSQDYCFEEAVHNLMSLCHQVVVVDCGSTDGTAERITQIARRYQADGDKRMSIIFCDHALWRDQHGFAKLAYFTNMAIRHLQTDWNINLQADEIIHESCFEAIREAIQNEDAQAYLVSRINLWKDPYHQLNVPQERLPVSNRIIRLARARYKAIGDAESIDAPARMDYVDKIRFYHMGFVRDAKIHPAKIRHMQAEVFETNVDPKLEGMEVFDSSQWFTDEDIEPIKEPLPLVIQEWAKSRP